MPGSTLTSMPVCSSTTKERTGISVKGIAAFCGVSVSAVKGWLYKKDIPNKKNMKKLDKLFEEKKDD